MSCLYGFKQNLRHILKQCLEDEYFKYLKSSYANLILLVDFVTADGNLAWSKRALKDQKASHILQQFQTTSQTELVIWDWDCSQDLGKSIKQMH